MTHAVVAKSVTMYIVEQGADHRHSQYGAPGRSSFPQSKGRKHFKVELAKLVHDFMYNNTV